MGYRQINNPLKKKSDKHPFYPSDDPIIKRRLKEDEEKHRKENEDVKRFRDMFIEAAEDNKKAPPTKKKGKCSCYDGYSRVKGTAPCAPGSCKKNSPAKLKDACYYKAKRAHKVFPSAYASGMIAKCRKNKGKK